MNANLLARIADDAVSACRRRATVALALDESRRVLHQTVNGDRGCRNLRGRCGCTHAEQRLVAWMAETQTRGVTLVVSLSPCTSCARLIVSFRDWVTRVEYLETYHDVGGLHVLSAAGIETRRL